MKTKRSSISRIALRAAAMLLAAAMALFVYLAEKKNMAWLESFSIAGSMLIGMAAAVLVRL